MLGAIIGDIIGSPYEFDRGGKTTDFPLFVEGSSYTDDTVMTIAVCEGIINSYGDTERAGHKIIKAMQKWGRKYPDAGYGARFNEWLHSNPPMPYNSYGNGSAMRVSSVAWLYDTLEEVEAYARISAEVTHDHPEGIKGAQATAAAIFLARQNTDKNYIRTYITNKYGYDLTRTCDEIRPKYRHVESCQETVPEAITAFLEGNSFEEIIRLAVSLGGDCDTLTAIAGSIAGGYYPIPEEMKNKARELLDKPLLKILDDFNEFYERKRKRRAERNNELIKKILEIKPYFDRCEKVKWEPLKREGDVLQLGYPIYTEEVGTLNEIVYDMGLAVRDYADVIDMFGVKKLPDEYKKRADNAPLSLLNAMLTDILRKEHFCEGSLADSIENCVVGILLTEIVSKLKSFSEK